MTEEQVADILKGVLARPIVFHRPFAEIAGSVEAGLMLSQAWYWRDKGKHGGDGWFHKAREEWFEETMLARRAQDNARSVLVNKGFMEERRAGQPARMWFRVNEEAVIRALIQLSKRSGQRGKEKDGFRGAMA